MSELKKCPACGGEAWINRDYDTDGFGKFLSYKCINCGFQSRPHFCSEECPLTYQEVKDTWNTQPRIEELKQRNKELEQAYTVLALKISQYLNGNLSVSAEDIKKEWKRGEQLLKGGE